MFSNSSPWCSGLLVMLTVVKIVARFLVPSCIPGASTVADFTTYPRWHTKAPFKTVFCNSKKISARAPHSNACVLSIFVYIVTRLPLRVCEFWRQHAFDGLSESYKRSKTVSTWTHLFLLPVTQLQRVTPPVPCTYLAVFSVQFPLFRETQCPNAVTGTALRLWSKPVMVFPSL